MSAQTEISAKKVTVPQVMGHKVGASGKLPLTMVTAYDAPSAQVVDRAGAEMILVPLLGLLV